jgi:hypothetical protein
MHFSALMLVVLAAMSTAQARALRAREDWASPVESYFDTLGKHIVTARAQQNRTATCDLSRAVMPTGKRMMLVP